MKAAFFKEHGGAEKVLYADYRDPVPGPDDVVVRVRACGLNHVDMLLLDGRFPPPEGLPHVNGCEVTGTLESVGAAVTGLAPGARVVVFPGFACGSCEYCLRGERTVCVRYGYLGAEPFENWVYALTGLGTLVTIGSHDTHWGQMDLRHVYSKNLRIVGTNLGSILELRTILDYVVAGRLKPVIDRAFGLKDARAAVQYVLDRKNKGKVLLVP